LLVEKDFILLTDPALPEARALGSEIRFAHLPSHTFGLLVSSPLLSLRMVVRGLSHYV